ncbi:MAG: TrkH family potassium uptake protein, partial [Burkholderiales bacterium]
MSHISNVLGMVIVLFGATLLLPLGAALWLNDSAAHVYTDSIALSLAAGGLLWAFTRNNKGELKVRDGFLLAATIWAVLPAFAGLPLLFLLPGLNFTDAYFEAVSGLTTTGAT